MQGASKMKAATNWELTVVIGDSYWRPERKEMSNPAQGMDLSGRPPVVFTPWQASTGC